MQEYLKEAVRLREVWVENALPVYRRFFKAGYDPYTPARSVEDAKAESVLSIDRRPDSTEVLTTGLGFQRVRYTLVAQGNGFVISLVEWECTMCSISEKPRPACTFCGGTGWARLPFKSPSSK